MEKSPFGEANSHFSYYRFQKTPPMAPILKQLKYINIYNMELDSFHNFLTLITSVFTLVA